MGFAALLASSQFDISQMTNAELFRDIGLLLLVAALVFSPIFFIVRSHVSMENKRYDSSAFFACLAIIVCLVSFVLFALTVRGQFNPVRIYGIDTGAVSSCPTSASEPFIEGSASDTDYIIFGIGNNESSKSPTVVAATARVPVNGGKWSVALDDLKFDEGSLQRIKPGGKYGISATREAELYVTMTKWNYCI